VCQYADAAARLRPCGHVCLCAGCAAAVTKLGRCPVCRQRAAGFDTEPQGAVPKDLNAGGAAATRPDAAAAPAVRRL
jgi:hypothetical protein